MVKVNYTLPKHKRINKFCDTCGQLIYFRRNYNGKMIPFNMKDDNEHFKVCLTPPSNNKPYKKPKEYKTIQGNTTLDNFIEIEV